ncbi:MAG: tetratricopeptide repeat protein, partial [Oricola sp.]
NEAKATAAPRRAGMSMLAAAALFAPMAAAVVYSITGSPGMDAQPLYARSEEIQRQQVTDALQNTDINRLVAMAEAALEKNPDDARGWDVLAPMYLRLDRPGDARDAFEHAIAMLGETPARRSGLGQAYYMLAGGAMDAHARAEFERALALDPSEGRARFFIALAAAESGDTPGALKSWQAMLDDANMPPEWQAAAGEGLRRYGGQALAAAPQASAPQLDAETMQNAQSMNAEDRQAMILGMISQLDARLRDNPDDVAGWQRLIRSYTVLGRQDDAQAALKRALDAFSGDETKHGEIVEFAAALGLSSGEATQ